MHQQELELFFVGQMAVVENDGIVSLAQGAHRSARINSVAFDEVVEHIVKFHLGIRFLQLVHASGSTHLGIGRDEKLQFCIGHDHGSNVAAVHDDPSGFSHALLQFHQLVANAGNGGD